MIRQLLAVLDVEIRMQLRQRMALVLLVVLPLLVVPGGIVATDLYVESLGRAASAHRSGTPDPQPVVAVAVEGDDPRVRGWLGTFDVVDAGAPADVVVAVVGDREIEVRYSSIHGVQGTAVRKALEEAWKTERKQALAAAGVTATAASTLKIRKVDAAEGAPPEDRIGAVVPPMLYFVVLVVALYTALDVISGEKERKTGESLLTTAVDRRVIVLAKALVVAGGSAVAAAIGLVALVVMAALGGLDGMMALGPAGAGTLLGPGVLGFGVVIVLLTVEVSVIFVSLAAFVADYRTGSMFSAPILVALLVLGAVGFLPVESSALTMLLPIVNVLLASRDAYAGSLSVPMGALGLAATIGHAAVGVALAARWLGQDSALVGVGDTGGRRALGWYGREAFALFVTVMVLAWFFGQLFLGGDAVWGTVATQVLLFALPALGAVAYLGLPLGETLQLRAPHPVDALLALVAGFGSPALLGLILWAQEPLVPIGGVAEWMGRLLLEGNPLWVSVLAFAVVPALCEELLFRGALVGLLRRSFGPVVVVLAVAVAFGLAHLMLPRVLPTAALGVLLGFAALRGRSLWVPVILHATNNAVAIGAGTAVDGVPITVLVVPAGVAILAVMGMGRR